VEREEAADHAMSEHLPRQPLRDAVVDDEQHDHDGDLTRNPRAARNGLHDRTSWRIGAWPGMTAHAGLFTCGLPGTGDRDRTSMTSLEGGTDSVRISRSGTYRPLEIACHDHHVT
jgi:hypothetical protein